MARLFEEGGGVLLFSVLPFCSVVWGNVWVGLILGRPWAGMFEASQRVFNVLGHRDTHLFVFVVSVNGEPNVVCARPVMGNCIVLFVGVHEVFGVLPAHILNPKIVNA